MDADIIEAMADLDPAEIAALPDDEWLEFKRAVADYGAGSKYYSFHPRANNAANWDEQQAFIDSKATFSVCLGGTGSGKTEAAAYKTAEYIFNTPPWRPRVPFWIVGYSMDQTTEVCWNEKLSHYIPEDMIYSVDWYRKNRNWPNAVTLKDPANKLRPGWVLEFKSYAQGLAAMKAASIGGYWCNEETPVEIVTEIRGRTRDYDSPGWADFTPIEVVSPEWPEIYNACMAGDKTSEWYRKGWKFFHLNTRENWALAEGWADDYLATIPDDMRDTRHIGTFSKLRGQVYKEWSEATHVLREFEPPHDWYKLRGVDFGGSNPFAMMFLAKSPKPVVTVGDMNFHRYVIFDEYYKQGELISTMAKAIRKQQPWLPDKVDAKTGKPLKSPYYLDTWADHDPTQIQEFNFYGIHMQPALKAGKKSASNKIMSGGVRGGIQLLRTLMMLRDNNGVPLLTCTRACKNFIREVRGYKWPEGTDSRDPHELPIPKNDHSLDAVRYAIFSDFASPESGSAYTTPRAWKPRMGVQLKRTRTGIPWQK